MACALINLWRRWVILFARRMPIESAGACMTFSVLALLTGVFILPEAAVYAPALPGLGQILAAAPDGRRIFRWMEATLITGAFLAAWLFQARCLQLCFPDYYDPYGID